MLLETAAKNPATKTQASGSQWQCLCLSSVDAVLLTLYDQTVVKKTTVWPNVCWILIMFSIVQV
jgi:hypothetical protein